MNWIKRNVALLLGALVALALVGLSAVYLVGRMSADKKAASEYEKTIADYKKIMSSDPFPTDENIQRTREESEFLKGVISRIKPLLVQQREPELEPQAFQALLSTTVDELTTRAEGIGVELRSKYAFTFEAQRSMAEFPTNSILPLTIQLREVAAICNLLFDAKIHSLDALRRVQAYSGEPVRSDSHLSNKITVTNRVGTTDLVITPYQVSFRGFSSELSSVLEGLQNSPIFFVVKTINIQPTRVPGATGSMADTAIGQAPRGMQPPGAASQPNAPDAPAPPDADGSQGLKTALEEQPLRISINLEVVKIMGQTPAGEPGAAPSSSDEGGMMSSP